MRSILATVVLLILIPCVLIAGLWTWAYFSTPALATEAYNRELTRSAQTMRLAQIPSPLLDQIRSDGPLPQVTAEALFFFPGPYQPNIFRNLERNIFASALAQRLTPDEQLQIYINHADFGQQHMGLSPGREIIGFPTAARNYFDKDLPNLTPEQLGALLDSLHHKSLQ